MNRSLKIAEAPKECLLIIVGCFLPRNLIHITQLIILERMMNGKSSPSNELLLKTKQNLEM